MARKPISKKLRFDIFKRDYFTCQYCGNSPPAVVLEVDHINPVKNGGENNEDNLITACFDCNRGKAANLLDSLPDTITGKAEKIAEVEEQIKGYEKVLKAKRRRQNKLIKAVEDIFKDSFPDLKFTASFNESIRANFVPFLTSEDLTMAIGKACSKINDSDAAIKYFCGICWNIRRGYENES